MSPEGGPPARRPSVVPVKRLRDTPLAGRSAVVVELARTRERAHKVQGRRSLSQGAECSVSSSGSGTSSSSSSLLALSKSVIICRSVEIAACAEGTLVVRRVVRKGRLWVQEALAHLK